jgi:hypothetical protein
MMNTPREPISLGYACEVKFQIARTLYERRFPNGSRLELERQLLTPELGQRSFDRHIFDWQITPFEAVLAYLDSDFEGVFEREDLALSSDGSGEVEHRRLGTRHPHDFHPRNGVLNEQVIDEQYPSARSKFDHLANKFRSLLKTPGNFLYVFRQIRVFDETIRLHKLLTAQCAEHNAHILYVGYPGEDQWLAGLEEIATKSWASAPAGSAERPPAWQGDDAAWSQALSPFSLRVRRTEAIKLSMAEVE